MELRVVHRLDEVPAERWNRLQGTDNPFLRHEFLNALEQTGCISPERGWLPWHLLLYREGELLGAMPAYLKGHSWGEFVFDFAWANAYERHGMAYYPKLVAAIPLSPVNGPRLLLAADADPAVVLAAIVSGVRQLLEEQELSSFHCLYPSPAQAAQLASAGLSLREGYQFHWHNQGWADFDGFLGSLSSKKRKNIRRERGQAVEAGVRFRRLHGPEIDRPTWAAFDGYYRDTFHRHGNLPLLSLEFFQRLGRELGEQVLLVVGERHGDLVGAALCLRGGDTLYGRYWGGDERLAGLHFETCYYQGIEYCLEHGLRRFEPGAQGEHKIARGFLPTLTYSAHWLRNPAMRAAIDRFLERERPLVRTHMAELQTHSPYRGEAQCHR